MKSKFGNYINLKFEKLYDYVFAYIYMHGK